jgi:hypothetical protein
MKKALILGLSFIVFSSPAIVSASTLNFSQVDAILTLLRAFNVNETVIATVKNELEPTTYVPQSDNSSQNSQQTTSVVSTETPITISSIPVPASATCTLSVNNDTGLLSWSITNGGYGTTTYDGINSKSVSFPWLSYINESANGSTAVFVSSHAVQAVNLFGTGQGSLMDSHAQTGTNVIDYSMTVTGGNTCATQWSVPLNFTRTN